MLFLSLIYLFSLFVPLAAHCTAAPPQTQDPVGLPAGRDAPHRHRLPRGAKAGQAPLEGGGQADATGEKRALRGNFLLSSVRNFFFDLDGVRCSLAGNFCVRMRRLGCHASVSSVHSRDERHVR